MLDIGSTELMLIVVVTIVVIGPKELPRVLYKVGQFMGKIRSVTRHFRTGIDAMVREVELEELQKKWALDNERIMKEHGPGADLGDPSTAAIADEAIMSGDTPPENPVASEDPAPIPYETPDYVVDAESLDDEHKPRPEAAA